MTDTPFLIAHKVRGEPAFDIAIQMRCPECVAHSQAFDDGSFTWGCDECDGEGYWWICSTSGHRAYPWWHTKLEGIGNMIWMTDGEGKSVRWICGFMPEGIPDHYRVNAAPRGKAAEAGRSLLAALGLGKAKAPIKRRI